MNFKMSKLKWKMNLNSSYPRKGTVCLSRLICIAKAGTNFGYGL
jgi:hypothetical protein